eukprot:7937-Heterococcus_DN1.PRE.2
MAAFEAKRRLEVAQDEWEIMKFIYHADMPTEKKRRLTCRQLANGRVDSTSNTSGKTRGASDKSKLESMRNV